MRLAWYQQRLMVIFEICGSHQYQVKNTLMAIFVML
jgi:hypothetical protein